MQKSFAVIRVNKTERRYLQAVLRLEKVCFEPAWHFQDARCCFREALNDVLNINLFLLRGARIVGYALAVSHQTAWKYLQDDDPLMKPNENMFYLETIQVHPKFQGKGGGQLLLKGIINACLLEGVSRLSVHARQVNGFNRLFRRLSGVHIDLSRNIESWGWGGGEPYEYLELSFGEENLRFRKDQ